MFVFFLCNDTYIFVLKKNVRLINRLEMNLIIFLIKYIIGPNIESVQECITIDLL